MTTEDAIEQFQNAVDLIKQNGKDWLDERDIPMLEMAICAFKNKQTDGDLISRKEVLGLAKDLTFEGGCKHRCVDVIKIIELPSAEKTASEKLDDIIVRAGVQNILDLLTRHTALLNDIKMMMPSEKTAEWISVRKQKPEDYEEVIATVIYDYKDKQEYEVVTGVRYSKEDGWEWAYEAGAEYWVSLDEEVVAWQPLPNPYKEK